MYEIDLKRKEFEREKNEAIKELKRRQENLKNIYKSNEKKLELEHISNLESKIRELDKKCELQNVLYEELQLEMASLKRIEQRKQQWKGQRSFSTEVSKESGISSPPDTVSSVSDTLFTTNREKRPSLNKSSDISSNKFNELIESKNKPIAASTTSMTKTTNSGYDSGNSSSEKRKGIDQILARLEQDNKTLAELEKSRQTIGMRLLLSFIALVAPSLTLKDLDKLMAKLEQDNRVLAELDRKVKRVASSSNTNTQSFAFLSSSLPSLSATHFGRSSSQLNSQGFGNNLPAGLTPSFNNTNLPLLHQQHRTDELRIAEDVVDSIEIPNRGRCKVFIARYSYDPFKQSPNENPEQELHLNAGDFILIFGDMDEDGFFLGELLDGRRGLVPSNFVEKLTGEDLFEFQASVLYGNRDGDESNASYPPEFYDAILNDAMGHTNFQHLLAPEDFHRMNDYVDLAESTEFDEEDLSDVERAQAVAARDPVLPPKRLILERQLHKSILIGWLHPDCPKGMIDSYQIYVDGVLKSTIPAGERTKALVEDVPFAPCCVKATNITSESALISWLPCNSNFYHVVAVNSVEVRTVGPGVYKHLITGLAANTLYRVSVRAKPGKLLCSDEKNPKKLEMLTTFVDFRTLPKSLPEPPVDVQVEAGPQEGTLLVTWLPVTLDQFGTSNGCPVTGYAVFAAHKKLAEIDSPTESYSEEEYETMMKNRGGRYGPSPVPPHRNRQLSEYERANLGHTDQHRMRANQKGVRWFVALYDYDPLTMSPNPDAADEELPFREGDMIKIHGDKDADGFYKGELNGRFGFVPCNMVSEVQYDPERGMIQQGGQDPWGHLPVKKMIALYDYDPQELSPNPDAEMELAFNVGDIIYIYGDMDEDGFYMGEINGVRGLVPSNFLTEVTSNESSTRHGIKQTPRGRGDPRMQQSQPPGSVIAQSSGPQQHLYTHPQSQTSQQQMSMGRGMGMRPQGPMAPQQYHPQQSGMPGNKQRPNTLDLGGSSPRFSNQVNHTGNQQPQQQSTLNPFSSLFASGKKILEEATTPRATAPQTSAQPGGGFGFGMSQNTQGMNAQMGRMGQQQQQPQMQQPMQYQQHQQFQQQHQQQPYQQQQQYQQQYQQGAAGTLTGALGAMKNIFKL
ncbi:RIMS-binding protein 2-like protein [Dinothrombium tinctorium]|uniref:RIMS-binding protein 2-like protein n=1 Tax=Dinothrombium tinctorium TaxID=1965070 RepID=A0A443R535_9ACAR|nr:RIMS-binding protein 2-like protein [Dinothrombium tinctorium]